MDVVDEIVWLAVARQQRQGRIQDFSKGGSQSNGYNYINYIIIAIIHIIILNKVHCSLLKAIGA